MAMYFMNGKTFLDKYIDEDPRKVMKTQFILVSSTIRKGGKYEKQVINANAMLFPEQQLILDYDDWKHNENYQIEYLEQISHHKAFLATLIKYAIEEKGTVVFLCGDREKKYYYLPLIQKYIEDEFGYHVYNYKKYKSGKEHAKEFDKDFVIKKCNKSLKKAKKREKEKQLSSERGKAQLLKSMDVKEMKKELKSRNLYVKGMSKSEMRDMLMEFM